MVPCLYQLMEARRRGMQGGVVTVYSMVHGSGSMFVSADGS